MHEIRSGTWRLAASLLLAGVVVAILAGLLHAESHDANDHEASFTAYANSDVWTAVHLAQFVGIALVCVGLVVLCFALDVRRGTQAWTARIGALAAATALGLYAALQAVDGVALKQAVDAWAASGEPEKAARFATAEGIRWLEWGMRSYQSFLLGTALILLGIVIAARRPVSRIIGLLMALSGLAYLAQGWIIGEVGFSAINSLPTLTGIVATVIWTIWLAVSAWRMKGAMAVKAG
ncbi:hypothetical protein QFZ36_000709 [Pseudarthrobacter siccitolerans]|uniref:DUF4386 family protein n=1 Tax=Pseudarthrobacter siccitolerans TaxID=861266 RepID=A0ABU0PGR9_9MICC|nr:DUF4386 family protein [Pseudarthrobacter siccitolerans]MDQ0673148.1 hypothetical protein [Pseudarthrobacter siccitolerans]